MLASPQSQTDFLHLELLSNTPVQPTMPSLVWKANPRGRAPRKEPEDSEFTRRKLTAADLPITGEQRQSIDALLNTFRKSGEFDKLRKAIFTQFETSSAKTSMKDAIEKLAESEVDRQPNLLSKERRQAVALIEGAVERSDIYRNAQTNVHQLVQQLLSQTEDTLRDLRQREIGTEAALEELKHGSKTDEEYEREFNKRRQERLAEAEEENERYRKEEEEERLRREEEKKRRKEEEEALEKEREKERAEREVRRRKEREEREKEREAEIEREREERRERRKREEERYLQESHDRERRIKERERSRDRSRERSRERRRARDDSRERTRRYSPEPRREEEVPLTEQSLEEIALQELLAEGQKLAKKSSKPPTRARSPSIEPPPRKILPPKSLVPRDPVAARLAKLDNSTTKSGSETPAKSREASRAPSVVPSVEKPIERRRSRSRSVEKESREDRRSSRYYDDDRRDRDDRRSSRRYDDDDDRRYRSSRYDDERDYRRRSRSRESYRDSHRTHDIYRSSRRDSSRRRSKSPDPERDERSRSRSRERLESIASASYAPSQRDREHHAIRRPSNATSVPPPPSGPLAAGAVPGKLHFASKVWKKADS
ncbi:hypothetical protein FKW77_006594 [Venturia effusa]|uniref:BOD1/SHG1 domain-containing protein n=1 Tax=Venturia effusa TaxID=50376 RepID=A0A517LP93_9PEZI|nr:hypothetical protein FKW77_006594 [Venturia effusa]